MPTAPEQRVEQIMNAVVFEPARSVRDRLRDIVQEIFDDGYTEGAVTQGEIDDERISELENRG